MKNLAVIFVLIISPFLTIAQIPNFNFNNWTSMGNYSNPANWSTMNNTTADSSIYTCIKGTNGIDGNFLHLVSRQIGKSVVNGVAVCGKLDTVNLKPISGFAFTGQPQSLAGYYENMGQSTGSIQVALTKWNATLNRRDTVAFVNHSVTGMQMSFAAFSIDLNYVSSMPPDSCIIFLSASGVAPKDFDYLNVDSLAFSGNVTAVAENKTELNEVSVYPNPATDEFSIKGKTQSQKVHYVICNLLGAEIQSGEIISIAGNYLGTVRTSDMARGIYFLRLNNDGNSYTQKLALE